MTTYKVTTELKTKWWWTILRFFRLKNKREEFEINYLYKQKWSINDNIVDLKLCDYYKILQIINYSETEYADIIIEQTKNFLKIKSN